MKTILGWTVNGPLRGDCNYDSTWGNRVATVSRISILTLDDLWEQQTKADFPECVEDEQPGLSRDDCQFLESVEKSVKLVDGHYNIDLPLRKKDVKMPNNRNVAVQRALSLKKRFMKDSLFHTHYTGFMSDSTSVLKYINNKTSRFKIFVANRVAEILSTTKSSQWRHVSTSSNPADLASRGTRVNTFLKSEVWLLGPSFLTEPEVKWPANIEFSGTLSAQDPEVKAVVSVNAVKAEEQVLSCVSLNTSRLGPG